MSITEKDLTIIPGQEFGPLEVEIINSSGVAAILLGYSVSASAWLRSDTLPLSANHDFDVETIYMVGALVNNEPTIVEYEIFEGDDN